ncbi:hypothetical protein CY35_02G114400 [Sphagnum magellanicum]|nr:hypothetical protein CY35_02G114400 [Sphagnum magellanicum]
MDTSSDSDDDKPLLARRVPVKKEMEVHAAVKPMDDDSDDDKPLVDRKPFKTYVRKDSLKKNALMADTASPKRAAQAQASAPPEKKLKALPSPVVESEPKKEPLSDNDDDGEDDVPLAQRKPSITSVKTTLATPPKSKPLPSSTSNANVVKKSLVKVMTIETGSTKRPAQAKPSLVPEKKIKVSPSFVGKSRVKEELSDDDDDDEDDVPIAQRKPSISSIKKTVLVQQKTKASSSSGCSANAAKKFLEKAKAQKLLKKKKVVKVTITKTKKEPGSGEGQKWQTLEHNGVIFPPPYESHGVKMLYDGKPVDLTNEQEEEKKRAKEEKLKAEEKYMWALVDGVKEKVGNFRVEPPGLFRGRGDHPKMGKLKTRIMPEDIVINIGKDAPIPECPIPGCRWKEIRHDNTVTWLAFWNDPINNKEFKYVFLAPSSNLKGQSDMQKYDKARVLKDYIADIRKTYTMDFSSSDPTRKQIAVATYLIDRLALRAGNEKDEDEADTVGCCSLKVEHVTLIAPNSLQFDFLGKDSIRYFNTVEVEEKVYKAIGQFKKGKPEGKDLFDKLDTTKLNLHLKAIMPGLTAKVFRTYNASITLDKLLQDTSGDTTIEKIADYQRANKEVAILCNHQRSISKGHGAQMERLEGKMTEMEALLEELEVDLDRAIKGKPPLKDSDGKVKKNQNPEALEKKIAATRQKVEKMRLDMRIKDDLKTVALGTSKINYMDPRITVAWCKLHEVPIEKIFNKSLLAKFAWAMEVEPDFRF